jgi:hypothetical protein
MGARVCAGAGVAASAQRKSAKAVSAARHFVSKAGHFVLSAWRFVLNSAGVWPRIFLCEPPGGLGLKVFENSVPTVLKG